MYPGVTRIVSRVSRVKMTINCTVKVHVFLCFKYNYYINRPQGKVIFLETSVRHSVRGGGGWGLGQPLLEADSLETDPHPGVTLQVGHG